MRAIEKNVFLWVSQYLDPIILINMRPIYPLSVIKKFWIPLPGLESPHSIKNFSAESHWPIVIFTIFIPQALNKLKRSK